MTNVVPVQFQTLEFEGEAKRKIQVLVDELASLLVEILATKRAFESQPIEADKEAAYEQNLRLREVYVSKLGQLEQIQNDICFINDVIEAVESSSGELRKGATDGKGGVMLATKADKLMIIVFEYRCLRFFGNDYRLLSHSLPRPSVRAA